LIIVDFETTGLPKSGLPPEQQPGIVQVGLMRLNEDYSEKSRLSIYVDPEMDIEEGAAKVHGITIEKLREEKAQPFSSVIYTLYPYFLGTKNWVGFNNSFDKTVLFNQLIRYGFQMKFPWPIFDTDVMLIGKDVCNIPGRQGIKPPKLVELHQFLFGVGFDAAHDAMADVCATHRCLVELVRREII